MTQPSPQPAQSNPHFRDDLWVRVLDRLRESLPGIDNWFQESDAVRDDDGAIRVSAATQFQAQWIEDRYGTKIQEACTEITGEPTKVYFTFQRPSPTKVIPTVTVDPPRADEGSSGATEKDGGGRARQRGPLLTSGYTFERFIIGSSNQLAHAACTAVADNPGNAYNPLFLYGSTGLGKTHLMHSIGHRVLQRNSSLAVSCLTTEEFTNRMVQAIRKGGTEAFRGRYRSRDLVLLDDIQFLEGKERTQEEFFHTFNWLSQRGKQVVVTSDRSPKSLGRLEDRLVSRFESGLVVDIKPPDLETRVAIAQQKAMDAGIALPTDIIQLVAERCASSVRELEGAILHIIAMQSISGEEVTTKQVRDRLREIAAPDSPEIRPPSPEAIIERVSAVFGVSPEGMASSSRSRVVTVPRQVAMWLMKKDAGITYKRIGGYFGARDHSTVYHAVRKIGSVLREDGDVRRAVEQIRSSLL